MKMMSRVYFYNLFLRILVYLLPVFAFGVSSYAGFGNVYGKNAFLHHYLMLFLFTELIWILATDYYKLSSVSDLFWEYTGIRAAFLAGFTTFLLQTALLVFFPQLEISRAFIVWTDLVMFLLVVVSRNFFRLTSTSSTWPRKCERILVVGTDHHARRYVKLLRRIPFFHCEIRAYLQLPGQPVLVQDAPVIKTTDSQQLEELSFDEVVVALPAWRHPQLPSVIDGLSALGKPIRAVFDLGPRLSLRDKLFQAGQIGRAHV